MNTKPISILLADDDIDDCYLFRKALEELPQTTQLSIVNDGTQLMDLLNDETKAFPDVLFLDINMPRKNGIECLAEIKHNKKLKEVSVVMFSTSNSREKIDGLLKTGAHVYIRKPGDFEQLKRTIQHALSMATDITFPNSQLKYILNA